jgi:hypothetical protein
MRYLQPSGVVRSLERFSLPFAGCEVRRSCRRRCFNFPLGASTSRCTGPEPAGMTEGSSSAPSGLPTRTQARKRMRRLPPAGD